jgi:hypothetical protein
MITAIDDDNNEKSFTQNDTGQFTTPFEENTGPQDAFILYTGPQDVFTSINKRTKQPDPIKPEIKCADDEKRNTETEAPITKAIDEFRNPESYLTNKDEQYRPPNTDTVARDIKFDASACYDIVTQESKDVLLVNPIPMNANEKSTINNTLNLTYKSLSLIAAPNIPPADNVKQLGSPATIKSEEAEAEDGDIGMNFRLCIKKLVLYIEIDAKIRYSYVFDIIMSNSNFSIYNIHVPAENVQKVDWIIKGSHGRAHIPNKSAEDIARKDIVELINNVIEREICFLTNGFKKMEDGTYGYVIPDGIIGRGKDQLPICSVSKNRLSYDPMLVGKNKTFWDTLGMMSITKDIIASLPLFLLTHMAFISTLYELTGLPLKFLVAYVGETNSKKTTIAKLLTQLFNVDSNEPCASFMSTECGLEEYCASQPDSVVLVDDLRPAISKEKQRDMNHKLEFLQRVYGDRYVKKRMTTFNLNNENIEFKPSGCCLITGELMNGVTSSLTRTIIVSTDRNQCNDNILSQYQSNKTLLPSHIYDFIAYVTENFAEVVRYIEDNVKKMREEMSKILFYDRFPEYYAQFSVIIDLIFNYGKSRGFIESQQANEYCTEYKDTIFRLLKDNEVALMEQNQIGLFIVKIYLEFQLGNIKFVDIKEGKTVRSDYYTSESTFYVKPERLVDLMKKNFGAQGMERSARDVLKMLDENGILVTAIESGQRRRSIKIPQIIDKNARYARINKSKLESFANEFTEKYQSY